MNDTPKHISEIQRRIIHSKTDEERSAMAAEMIDSVYKMIKERIWKEHPELNEKEVTAKLFERYYSKEFTEKEKQAIKESITN